MDIVLVHGSYHGAWCWDLLRPELERLGHRVITMDLPIRVCRDDRATNPVCGLTAARERLGTEPDEIDGGHSPFLTRPGELARLLDSMAG